MGKVTKVEVPLPADDLPTHTRLCTKRLGITGYYLFRHIWLFRYWALSLSMHSFYHDRNGTMR
jgi:hypothetical protein